MVTTAVLMVETPLLASVASKLSGLTMGCYEPKRFPSHEAMVEQLMKIYQAHPILRVPSAAEISP